MDSRQQLSIEQGLQQTLSPLQVQYARLLEMTSGEVHDEIMQALDDNPALEATTDDDLAPIVEDQDGEGDFNETAEEMQLADYGNEDDIPWYKMESGNRSDDNGYREPIAVAAGDTIYDYLMGQLHHTGLDEADMALASLIVGNIDNNGYLTRTPSAIVDDAEQQLGIEVPLEHVRHVWDVVKSCDPPGVGAMDLRECLLLQLRRREDTPSVVLARRIVGDYFDVFSRMHYDRLESMLGVDRDTLRSAVDVIRALNPKPGSAVVDSGIDDRLRHITPDFVVDVADEGDSNSPLTISMPNTLPHLQIEHTYANVDEVTPGRRLSRRELDAVTFMRRKRDDADMLIQALGMRQQTLYRVMAAIIKLQRDFFMSGEERQLHPMILKDVAQLTGYDISVVSRATSGKYVATRQGIYPLKFFFNERPKDDLDMSTHEILAALKVVIDDEDKSHPLTDEELTARLKEQGYDIARRTVAKYRERLGLPVARLRRKV